MKLAKTMDSVANFFSKRLLTITPICVLMLAIVTVYVANPSVAIYVDGELLGTTSSTEEFETIKSDLENYVSDILDKPYSLDVEVEYKLTYENPTLNPIDLTSVEQNLAADINEIDTLAVLYIDGEPTYALDTVETANDVLQDVLVALVGEELADKANFVENIYVKEEIVPTTMLSTPDAVKADLTATEVGAATHTVAANETLSAIAVMYDMPSSEVEALNPELEPARIQIGQEIVIEKAQPAISVEVLEQITYTEDIAYDTETTYDDSMTTSQKKTITSGQVGVTEIVANVTYVNGVETSREIVSETTIKEPVTAVVSVGTKPSVTTGELKYPVYGANLTSNYGYRWGGFHTGIDLADPVGTPIYAADGGTVIFSSYKGSYGNLVIIDHGNGMTTYYAHCSSNLVSVGEQVNQGDLIAKMGSTGNSTGSHLHFEVRINNSHVNPFNYLP